jgi:hypothetical protein
MTSGRSGSSFEIEAPGEIELFRWGMVKGEFVVPILINNGLDCKA